MNKEETRKLGIEFERRIQTIDPTTEITNKLDTETIYAFLNQYQDQYIQQMLIAGSQPVDNRMQINSAVLSKIQSALRTGVNIHAKTADDDTTVLSYYVDYNLPEDFMSYISSVSSVGKSYNSKSGDLSNVLVTPADFKYLTEQTFDEDRIIRHPLVLLYGDKMRVAFDRYSFNFRPDSDGDLTYSVPVIYLMYYRRPNNFSPLTDTNCELPIECFEDIVSGAVELYFNTRYRLAIAQSNSRNRRNNQTNEQ